VGLGPCTYVVTHSHFFSGAKYENTQATGMQQANEELHGT